MMKLTRADDGYEGGCNKCEKLRIKDQKIRRAAKFCTNDPDSLFIEHDPIPVYEGGFREGVPITQIQVECMCNVGTFSEGTILRDKHNNRFQVCMNYDGRQQLMSI